MTKDKTTTLVTHCLNKLTIVINWICQEDSLTTSAKNCKGKLN